MLKFDLLVIGGGIAGLSYALKVSKHGSVAVLFKKGLSESSTAWAQGGIAAVSEKNDNFDFHIEDTLVAGAGLCNPKTVEFVIKEAPARIEELIDIGVEFDKKKANNEYHLNKEGGHSERRIFHVADHTGYEIQTKLLESVKNNPSIKLYENHSAIDLVTTHKFGLELNKKNKVLGAYVLNPEGNIELFIAEKVLVATGGAGKVYLYTSNPDVASGDGIAMCYRAGVAVANMEFYQFHPTCLYHPRAKSFLITEAMRGEGAKLKRINGEKFMEKYHPDAELAPRDVVARAIDHEMKVHGEEFVYLDISHKKSDFIKTHFPMIYSKCLEFGIDITKEAIPVVPAAHYCCGGVVSNEFGETSLENLYVAGESANTGLHGANRLASNSLLEGVVFAARAANKSIETFHSLREIYNIPEWDSGKAVDNDEQVIISQNWDEIRRFMFNYVGIVRSDKRLERALRRSELLENEIQEYYRNFKVNSDLIELRNLSLVANLIIRSALDRKESRGLHYNIDHPMSRKIYEKDTVIYPLADRKKIS